MELIKKFALPKILLISLSTGLLAQNPQSFFKEVKELTQRNDSLWDNTRETIIFTGSSSVRKWDNLQQSFPHHQVLNAGFGGSQASDLLYYLDTLVIKYKPIKVFIYEGDNDIAAKKRPREILGTTDSIVKRIRGYNPVTEIILISAKPSISRWNLRGKYRRLNRKFRKMAQADMAMHYVDVWSPMLNGKKLRNDIFVADGLHMNTKGYEIWYNALQKFVNTP